VNRLLIFSVAIFSSFAGAQAPTAKAAHTPGMVTMAYGPNGELLYRSGEVIQGYTLANSDLVDRALERSIEMARTVVCDMSVLPDSITISSLVVSVTYQTKQFCKKAK
jgi:ATP-dependent helicase YprA (DUF1998 family)